MPAKASEIARFRRRLDCPNESDYADLDIQDVFEEVEEDYPNDARRVQFLRALLIGIRELRAGAAKRVTYSQGGSSISLSDVYRNLKQMEDDYKKELDELLKETEVSIRWGSPNRTPPRERDLPDA